MQNNAKQKDQSTVYPIALLRHLYKKKPSVADFAKLKMEAAVQQKRKMMRKMMLPAALSEKKPLRGGTKSAEDQVANLESGNSADARQAQTSRPNTHPNQNNQW